MSYQFPDGFTWGTATAAYQVEGAVNEDGRVPSIWDTFCDEPGRIADGTTGAVACDEYHRYPEDIALMQELGVNAYRLSIAWSRIITDLSGTVNQQGLDHYRRVFDLLRDKGIKPVVTLYHWDLPQYLQNLGGWSNRDTAYRFADYVQLLAATFGDQIDTWTTLNEPWCSAFLGHSIGLHAPGIQDPVTTLRAVHHLNLAHGLGAQAVRTQLGQRARVSVTLNLNTAVAVTDSPEDLAAERLAKLVSNDIFLGPMLEGKYDPAIFEATKDITDWGFVRDGDTAITHQSVQVLGLNYYSPNHVRAATAEERAAIDAGQRKPGDLGQRYTVVEPPTGLVSATNWSVEPEYLVSTLREISERFPGQELWVTENGSAWDDEVVTDPAVSDLVPGGLIVHDPQRVNYLNLHVQAAAEAIQQGINLTGYFVWSLLDNFEWASGNSIRFGLFRTDYQTQQRIWKDSALRYRQIVRSNSIG